jgi:hypothetical protein
LRCILALSSFAPAALLLVGCFACFPLIPCRGGIWCNATIRSSHCLAFAAEQGNFQAQGARRDLAGAGRSGSPPPVMLKTAGGAEAFSRSQLQVATCDLGRPNSDGTKDGFGQIFIFQGAKVVFFNFQGAMAPVATEDIRPPSRSRASALSTGYR